jgi:hypothetical protein
MPVRDFIAVFVYVKFDLDVIRIWGFGKGRALSYSIDRYKHPNVNNCCTYTHHPRPQDLFTDSI